MIYQMNERYAQYNWKPDNGENVVGQFTLRKMKNCTEIWCLGILGLENRNKGYGQQMMQELIREHGHENLRLYVESHNHRAIHIYEKFGFQYVKNYGDSDTVRIMIRKATVQPTPVAV